ncbi:glycosyltransferase family 4 protein [Klebsiella quasipneumoniae]|uniref:glycosyltransferase family 4 protein n=1 Tax=Klebsiella quasipneumoniae TaxID=1463165 RepID=UPI001C26AD60|nr:glycosyltransferase family 4 protein [Klebsiella quasipneumoniae]MBU8944449.1 glycosyltransferase family 4 protein [Klebsiella quasipneumoniae]
MKIVLINTLYYPYRIGGAEVSVQFLAEQFAAIGHDVSVITLHEKKNRQEERINNVNVIYLPLKNIYWPYSNRDVPKIKKIIWHLLDCYNFGMRKKVLNEIKKNQPDIVHTNNLSGFSVSVWDAIKSLDIRLVHTSRDYYLFHPNSTLFKGGNVMSETSLSVKFWSKIKKYKTSKVDSYVGISQFIQKLHTENKFFPNASKFVIYNSVKKVLCEPKKDHIIRVGFIGRLTLEKGFDEYCNLAKEYINNSSYTFSAAGNFSNSASNKMLQELAKHSGIILLGYMDVIDFLNKVDVVILPIKWNEPFGRTVVECALAGKLVFTTPVGAMPELSRILPNVIISTSIKEKFVDVMSSKDWLTSIKTDTEIFEPGEIAEKYIEIYKK